MWFEGTSLWFSNSAPPVIDWSMSCWAHDKSWMVCTLSEKIRSDFALFMDVWAIAALGDTWWKRAAIRLNAVAMLTAVATVGWAIFLKKWIVKKITSNSKMN